MDPEGRERMWRDAREETDVDRRTDILVFGLVATAAWAVLFFMAVGEGDSVAAGAVVGWIGLVAVGFCLGVSIPVDFPSLFPREAKNGSRGPLHRQRDLLLALLILGFSGQMIFPVSSQRWDHLPSLLLSIIAVIGGYRLARAVRDVGHQADSNQTTR